MDIEQNIGQKDKSMRLAGAAIAAVLALLLSGPLETLLWIVAAVLVVTSVMGFCPAYTFMNKNTCEAGEGEGKKGKCCGGSCHGKKAGEPAEEKAEAEAEVEADDAKDDDKAA